VCELLKVRGAQTVALLQLSPIEYFKKHFLSGYKLAVAAKDLPKEEDQTADDEA
jgi:hypothetical protein